ncbi:hypothetical protein BDV38DRAFT_281423 [Aspergillus pseudotamarii]|uniref:F-box domain-containing protein n=1 Tax=Aspergillus pseudotamarii TaxID=132259 RepID=A0A5N6SX49_ASPPS|nr:uncharacterized protein BDV38DRAFT_281423 [Aspergillus pseudotamarii]KAE8139258.1 hypothetical protein BDV38DRAFT_281423 [Aspergillus pseudotamarii]
MLDPAVMFSLERSRRSMLPEHMAQRLSDASRIFFTPEILEAILLSLDMHTLLISARVCCTWNSLIKSPRKIQRALFYIPSDTVAPGQPRVKNPLVVEKIWVEFIRTQLYSRPRVGGWLCGGLREIPYISSEKTEEAYLRPEVSWRRILLQQPPNSIVRFWNPENPDRPYSHHHGMIDTHAKWMPNRDYIRMDNVQYWVDIGAFSPGLLPFLCWVDPLLMSKVRSRTRLAKDTVLAKYLAQFDLTINTDYHCCPVIKPDPDDPNPRKQAGFPEWCEESDVSLLWGEPN